MKVVVTLVMLLGLLAPSMSLGVRAQGVGPVSIDYASIALTGDDLEAEGFEGYAVVYANPYGLEIDVDYLSQTQELDAETVEEVFTDAGYEGSYVHTWQLSEDEEDPLGNPERQVLTTVYIFEDADGAAEAYELIADESEVSVVEDIEDAGERIGDQSELSVGSYVGSGEDQPTYTEIELEMQVDRLVLAVAALEFAPGEDEAPEADPDDFSAVEALGERLVERAETTLDGDGPNLLPLAITLDSVDGELSFVTYDLLDGEGLRPVIQAEEDYEAQMEERLDDGMTHLLRVEQFLAARTDDLPALRLYDFLFSFETEDDAEAYMADRDEDLSDSTLNKNVEVEPVDGLGDEAVMVTITRETNGEEWSYRQIFARVGTTITGLVIQRDFADNETSVDAPEDALIALAELQVECIEDEACEGPIELPEEVEEFVDEVTDI